MYTFEISDYFVFPTKISEPIVMALVSHNRMVPTSEIGYFMYCKCE